MLCRKTCYNLAIQYRLHHEICDLNIGASVTPHIPLRNCKAMEQTKCQSAVSKSESSIVHPPVPIPIAVYHSNAGKILSALFLEASLQLKHLDNSVNHSLQNCNLRSIQLSTIMRIIFLSLMIVLYFFTSLDYLHLLITNTTIHTVIKLIKASREVRSQT